MTATVTRFELSAVDLPFRVSFKHSAAERRRSESLFLKCVTDLHMHLTDVLAELTEGRKILFYINPIPLGSHS